MNSPQNSAQTVYHTVDEIMALPEGKRAELIDGIIYDMAAPSRIHQDIVHGFDRLIGNYIAEHRGDCKVYPAPFAVFINRDKFSYVEPDISVICDKSKLDAQGCNGAPDWIVEVVSPSTRTMDYIVKLFKYKEAGVREYWIVDPMISRVRVYNFEGTGHYEEYTFEEAVPSGIYQGLELTVSEML